jgi:hypothetical protein
MPLALWLLVAAPAFSHGPSASRPAVAPAMHARPSIIPYEPGMVIPPGAYVKKKSLAGVWGAGIGLLAASWVLTFSTTSFLCSAGCVRWAVPVSFIPVFGPAVNTGISVAPVAVFMVAMTIFQAGAVGMIVGGALGQKKYLVLTPGGVAGQF